MLKKALDVAVTCGNSGNIVIVPKSMKAKKDRIIERNILLTRGKKLT